MHISTASITSKGQISLPKKIRDILGTNSVSIKINDAQEIILSPIHDLAGSLSEYKNTADIPFEEIRQKSWEDNTKHVKSNK